MRHQVAPCHGASYPTETMGNKLAVYVAGASAEVERASEVIERIRALGLVVTHDWTRSVREHRSAGYRDVDLDHERQAMIASEDLDAVRRADVLLLLAPESPTIGAWVELGCALNLANMTIFVSGPASRQSIFTSLADWIFTDDDAAVQALANAAEGKEAAE